MNSAPLESIKIEICTPYGNIFLKNLINNFFYMKIMVMIFDFQGEFKLFFKVIIW